MFDRKDIIIMSCVLGFTGIMFIVMYIIFAMDIQLNHTDSPSSLRHGETFE